MALTTVSVYKRVLSNNLATDMVSSPVTEGFETTRVAWFGPSLCNVGSGPEARASSVASKIVIAGGTNDKYSRVTLYTSSTVAQIAALT
jgi:hypothetical protein